MKKKESRREKKDTQRTGFSGNVVLNICELDDTHLKQREGRWEGAMIEGRKEEEGGGGGGIEGCKDRKAEKHGGGKNGRRNNGD